MNFALIAWSLLLLPRLASAAAGNLTITFFPSTDNTTSPSNPTCPDIKSAQSSALSLTTSSIPFAFTCFSLSTLFSQQSPLTSSNILINGFQPGQGSSSINSSNSDLSTGVNYTILTHPTTFSPLNNYTRLLIQQTNITSEQAGVGRPSGRRVNVYSLPDCQQLSTANGGDDPEEWNPWYLQSCQTGSEGVCRGLQKGVLSFSVQEDSGSECEEWTFLGAGMGTRERMWGLRGVGAVVVGVVGWVML
ncbi:hypothetical protein DL98DRAFT_592021 [Cadophora sp. DSE1049]|nr:hypothetical protein DL98DRAFT_592021 [Cadophora sp. DSE1049]